MKLWVRVESREKAVEIVEKDGFYMVSLDGETHVVDCRSAGHRDYLSLLINNRSHLVESAPIRIDDGLYYVNVNGRRYQLEVLDERLVATRTAGGAASVSATYTVSSPMPGLIVDVRVSVGDEVAAGSPVVIMEAMKMQNELVSEVDGVVTAVNVAASDTVDSQSPLVEIERKRAE